MPLNDFIEIRFPEKVAFGFAGGPRFNTTVVSQRGGHEHRLANYAQPLHVYRAAHTQKEQFETDELKSFFMAMRGQLVGFRFRDWTDYASYMPGVIAEPPSVEGNELPSASAMAAGRQPMRRSDGALGAGDGSSTVYQLVKVYRAADDPVVATFLGGVTLSFNDNDPSADTITRPSGSFITDGFAAGQTVRPYGSVSNERRYTIDTANTLTLTLASSDAVVAEALVGGVVLLGNAYGSDPLIRDIKKPAGSSSATAAVRVFVNSVAQTEGVDYTVDVTTGAVTFSVAPPLGQTVEADFLFDVPVRLGGDDFDASLELFNFEAWDGIELREVRSP